MQYVCPCDSPWSEVIQVTVTITLTYSIILCLSTHIQVTMLLCLLVCASLSLFFFLFSCWIIWSEFPSVTFKLTCLSLSHSGAVKVSYCSPGLASCIKKPDCSITSCNRPVCCGVFFSLSFPFFLSLFLRLSFHFSFSHLSLSAPLIWWVGSLQTGSRRLSKRDRETEWLGKK